MKEYGKLKQRELQQIKRDVEEVRGAIDCLLASVSQSDKRRIAEWCFLKRANDLGQWDERFSLKAIADPERIEYELTTMDHFDITAHQRKIQKRIQRLHNVYFEMQTLIAKEEGRGEPKRREVAEDDYPAWPYVWY